MVHIYDAQIACDYGLEEAILIQNFAFWISKNAANGTAFHDGRYWTFHSFDALLKLLPELKSVDRIKRFIKKLINQDILIKGNYNKMPMDRTCWYAFSDKGLELILRYNISAQCIVQNCQMDSAEMPIPSGKIARAITDESDDDIYTPLYNSPLTGEIIYPPEGETTEKSKPKKVEKPKEKKELDMSCVPASFKEVIDVWLKYKKEKQQTYKQIGFNAMVEKLIKYSNGNPETAKEIILDAMSNNYSGFFPLKRQTGGQQEESVLDTMRKADAIYWKRKQMEEEYARQHPEETELPI